MPPSSLPNYDVMVASLNRPDSLRACLALFEQQTVRPKRVVVADASDDFEATKAAVLTDRDRDIEWIFVRSTTRSLVFQRNLGLAHVTSDVVFLPDDDSMLYPDAAEHVLAAYARDDEGVLGGVALAVAHRHPEGRDEEQRTGGSRLKQQIGPLRNRLEAAVAPSPFIRHAQAQLDSRPAPGWMDGVTYRPLTLMGGYQATYRTSVVRDLRFDENLGYGVGYSTHEDHEMALRIHNAGHMLAAAERAFVFHDSHPSKRAGGFAYGFAWFANLLYSCRKNIPESSTVWQRDVPRFLRYKLALYRARAMASRDDYSRDVYRGALAAWKARGRFDEPDLGAAYRALCDDFLASR